MTKKEMKETIKKRVNNNWNFLRIMEKVYGVDSYEARIARCSWAELDDIWNTFFPNEDWGY